MRPLSRLFLPLLSFAALASAPAASAQPRHDDHACDDDRNGGSIDATAQVKPKGLVDVHQFGGSVRVTTWAQSAVRVKGQFSPDCHVEMSASGDREEIHLSCSHGPGEGDLELQIPQGSSLDVRAMSADVSALNVSGASLHVQTVTGDIAIKGGAPNEIEVHSTSGGVTIEAASPVTRVHSISGDVSVKGVRGRATIRSVSGECTLAGGEFSSVEVETVSGDVLFTGAVAGQGTFEVQSHSGEVSLHLPPTTSADVEMHSMSGDLVIDMGSGRKTGERELVGRIGAGGAKLRLRSFSGDLKITQ